MEMRFCRRCSLELKKDGDRYVCPNSHSTYPSPNPSVCILIQKPNSHTLLLSVRGIEPRKGELDSIGGFVDEDETFEQAAIRELEEETGLTPDDVTNLEYLCSAPNIYPFEGEDIQVLSVIFTCTIKAGAIPVAKDDVAEIVEIDIDDLDLDTITSNDNLVGITELKERMNR